MRKLELGRAEDVTVGGPTGTAAIEAIAPSPARGPALALIDGHGEVVRLTETFRADFAPEGSEQFAIWDFLADPAQRMQLGRVLEGRLLRADLALPSAAGSVVAAAEAVLDAAVTRHALLTVAQVGPDSEPRSGADALLDDPSVEISQAIVWITDLSGSYLRINRSYAARLGIDQASIKGRSGADLSAAHVVAAPQLVGHRGDGPEPVQLEYTVPATAGREALTVLRFPLHAQDGSAVAVCGVAAPVAEAATARTEAERLLRIERWAGLSVAAIRAELIEEWHLAELAEPEEPAGPAPILGSGRFSESAASDAAATAELEKLRHELEAARTVTTELEARLGDELVAKAALDARLAEEVAHAAQLRDAVASASRRAEELENAERELAGERARAEAAEREAAAARARAEKAETEFAGVRARADSAEPMAVAARAQAEQAEREVAAARARAENAEREAAAAQARAENAERELTGVRARAENAERELTTARVRVAELERAHATAAVGLEEATAASTARAELERQLAEARRRADEAERSLATELVDATRIRDELIARAGQAEAAIAEARATGAKAAAAAQRAEALAELARGRAEGLETAVTSAQEAEAESRKALDRDRAEIAHLQAALRQAQVTSEAAQAAAREASERLDRERREIAARPGGVKVDGEAFKRLDELARQPPMPVGSPAGPAWSHGAQRALTASLAAATEWRTGLKDVLRVVGSEGGWDAAVAWCPDERTSALRCVAMWIPEPNQLGLFETATWQRRQSATASSAGRAAESDHATWLADLSAIKDPQLAGAAAVGMRAALLVPIRHNGAASGVLELLTRESTAPGPDIASGMEAVALQLAHFEYLLRRGAEPRWRMGRM